MVSFLVHVTTEIRPLLLFIFIILLMNKHNPCCSRPTFILSAHLHQWFKYSKLLRGSWTHNSFIYALTQTMKYSKIMKWYTLKMLHLEKEKKDTLKRNKNMLLTIIKWLTLAVSFPFHSRPVWWGWDQCSSQGHCNVETGKNQTQTVDKFGSMLLSKVLFSYASAFGLPLRFIGRISIVECVVNIQHNPILLWSLCRWLGGDGILTKQEGQSSMVLQNQMTWF